MSRSEKIEVMAYEGEAACVNALGVNGYTTEPRPVYDKVRATREVSN